MSAGDVGEVLTQLAGLRLWLDGGWGVDALLGRQTRPHSDLDVAIDARDLAAAVQRLAPLGFAHARDVQPGLPPRFVLRDPRGRQLDFHVLRFDPRGDGWQTLPNGTRGHYPGEDLEWTGEIAGRAVRCISPTLQVRHHTGYERLERDRLDLERLAERFRLELPETIETGA